MCICKVLTMNNNNITIKDNGDGTYLVRYPILKRKAMDKVIASVYRSEKRKGRSGRVYSIGIAGWNKWTVRTYKR